MNYSKAIDLVFRVYGKHPRSEKDAKVFCKYISLGELVEHDPEHKLDLKALREWALSE